MRWLALLLCIVGSPVPLFEDDDCELTWKDGLVDWKTLRDLLSAGDRDGAAPLLASVRKVDRKTAQAECRFGVIAACLADAATSAALDCITAPP